MEDADAFVVVDIVDKGPTSHAAILSEVHVGLRITAEAIAVHVGLGSTVGEAGVAAS